MALPTTEQPAVNETFKAENFNNLDSLLRELNVQRQIFETPKPEGDLPPVETNNLTEEQLIQGEATISREDAERAGRRMAVMVDSVISVAAMTIAKEDANEKYKASEGEINDLSDACSEVSEQYKFKINPWINVMILITMIYLPKIIQATNDRRIKIMEERQKELEDRMQIIELRSKQNGEAGTASS